MTHGLYRPVGGAECLWGRLLDAFVSAGGDFRARHELVSVERRDGGWTLGFRRAQAPVWYRQLVSAIPVWNTYRIAPQLFNGRLESYLPRRERLDSAFRLYLGLRDDFAPDVSCHTQVLQRLDASLNDGNNFLISLSERGDLG